MGQIKSDEHEAFRKWALDQGMQDPETLVGRKDGAIVFKSSTSGKNYRRMQKQYRDYQRDQREIRLEREAMQKANPHSNTV